MFKFALPALEYLHVSFPPARGDHLYPLPVPYTPHDLSAMRAERDDDSAFVKLLAEANPTLTFVSVDWGNIHGWERSFWRIKSPSGEAADEPRMEPVPSVTGHHLRELSLKSTLR